MPTHPSHSKPRKSDYQTNAKPVRPNSADTPSSGKPVLTSEEPSLRQSTEDIHPPRTSAKTASSPNAALPKSGGPASSISNSSQLELLEIILLTIIAIFIVAFVCFVFFFGNGVRPFRDFFIFFNCSQLLPSLSKIPDIFSGETGFILIIIWIYNGIFIIGWIVKKARKKDPNTKAFDTIITILLTTIVIFMTRPAPYVIQPSIIHVTSEHGIAQDPVYRPFVLHRALYQRKVTSVDQMADLDFRIKIANKNANMVTIECLRLSIELRESRQPMTHIKSGYLTPSVTLPAKIEPFSALNVPFSSSAHAIFSFLDDAYTQYCQEKGETVDPFFLDVVITTSCDDATGENFITSYTFPLSFFTLPSQEQKEPPDR